MTTHYDSATAAKRPQLLKVSDVAQLLNVKPRTIYEMVAQDRIPYRKPPGSNILRFDLEEILEWTRRKQLMTCRIDAATIRRVLLVAATL
jgi:excisionase family DNA binding protein